MEKRRVFFATVCKVVISGEAERYIP